MFTSSRESFVLSDRSIMKAIREGQIAVAGVDLTGDVLQPASVDVRLDRELVLFTDAYDEIDPEAHQPDLTVRKKIGPSGFSLMPDEFVLGSTRENLTLNSSIAADFTGKSSLARLGLVVHMTAGYIDPGFSGKVTLEIRNMNRKPIRLRAGMKIGQFKFFRLDTTCLRPYGTEGLDSHYQGQQGVTPSLSWMSS